MLVWFKPFVRPILFFLWAYLKEHEKKGAYEFIDEENMMNHEDE